MMKHYRTLYVELYDKRAFLIRKSVNEKDKGEQIALDRKVQNLDEILHKLDMILGYNL